MPIHRLFPEDIEVFTLETNPSTTFISSSTSGITGSVHVYARRSLIEKEVHPLSAFSSSWFQDTDINALLNKARTDSFASSNNQTDMLGYLAAVNSQSASPRKQQIQEIIRFTPGVSLDKDTLRKNAVIDLLMPFYRNIYPSANWSYTNFNCLNFFTSSFVPTGSVLLYPQIVSVDSLSNLSGRYIPSGAFSFDFWINPRYTTDGQGTNAKFKAGTVMHLSSTYAVSLITGSGKDVNQRPVGYRLLLQLSSSAGLLPSSINTSSLPQFAFLSDDNSLLKNHWHHATIRWGTSDYNLGSGSFVIDGETKGTFVVPSASITPKTFVPTSDNPTVLCVGNFYEGTNNSLAAQAFFFGFDTAQREGLLQLDPTPGISQPNAFQFAHPLNAEVHDLKIYSKYLNNTEIASVRARGPDITSDLLFYLPPLFTRESPRRSFYAGSGGVLTTPFFTKDGSTFHPFGVDLSFDIAGHNINLENFVRDFAAVDIPRYPRLWELSASAILTPSIVPQTANMLLYATASVRKRALTILPCDNGVFYPNYSLLSRLDQTSFVTDFGGTEIGSISLLNMYPTASIFTGLLSDNSGSIIRELIGPDPTDLTTIGVAPGRVPTILQRTRDTSSNQVCFFDISNLFYGNQIDPNTLTIWDTNLSGSGGKVRITLKDDGIGNLYRADSTGSLATWNSVGNVFYNEGIIAVKSPHLYFFGEEGFGISFKGQQNLHFLHLNCIASPLLETSSSNPTYLPVSASDAANATDQKYVYITDVLIQDDNLNVIGRTKMAQPIVKRTGDKMLFKFSMTF